MESCCIERVAHTRRWTLHKANDSSPITASLQGAVPLSIPRRAENAILQWPQLSSLLALPPCTLLAINVTESNEYGAARHYHPASPTCKPKASAHLEQNISELFSLVGAGCPIHGTGGFKAQKKACLEPIHDLQ